MNSRNAKRSKRIRPRQLHQSAANTLPVTRLKDILRLVQHHHIFTGMENPTAQSQTWPDLAIGLYDKLTGRGAEITYELHNLELSIPSSTSPQAQHALWKVNGTVKIRTRDDKTTPRA